LVEKNLMKRGSSCSNIEIRTYPDYFEVVTSGALVVSIKVRDAIQNTPEHAVVHNAVFILATSDLISLLRVALFQELKNCLAGAV
jgi:hypothetical protein